MDETTQIGTIWSQTLLDVLCVAVRQRKDADARDILRDMRSKGYRKDQIRKYAAKNLEPAELSALESLLKSSGSK